MPQDIPVEASEELVFTPETFASLGDEAPTFTLRAATTRDKRYHRRLHVEEGIILHSHQAIREEVLAGLKALWSEDVFEQHSATVKAYWEAQDDFLLQAKADPDLKFEYDPEIAAAIDELMRKVADSWRPLRRLMADNAEFEETSPAVMVAVCVKGWTGLDLRPDRERGYLTFASAEALREEISAFEKKCGFPEGRAWTELFVACTKRMYLDAEEEKNSASPSPSETTQPASTGTKASARGGKSPASARSKKTRAAA